jgi:hypothetical protein
MKRIFAFVVLLSLTAPVMSQITITKNDMPVAGDTIRYSSSNTRLNFDTTGAGITWDYSALVASGQGVDSFRSAFSISPVYNLFFGLTAFGQKALNNLNFGTVSLTNIFYFYKTSTSKFEINGIGAQANGVPLPSNYSITDKLYQFPLSYGRADTSDFDVTISVPTLATIRQKGKRYNYVDGWGTVMTPYGSFPCIRLVSKVVEVDSITISAFGITFPQQRNTTTYKWLANGEHIPVLEVSGNTPQFGSFIPTTEKYRDTIRFVPPQFTERANFIADKTVCTAADTVTITTRNRPNPPGTTYLYTIQPATFNYVSGTSATSASPKVNFTAPGFYTVSQHVEAPAGGSVPAVGDTTKVDYIQVTQYNGIEDIMEQTLQLYPNPANDHLTCTWQSDMGQQVVLRMIDTKGAVVYNGTATGGSNTTINTAGLPAGEYLLIGAGAEGSIAMRKVLVVQ